MRTLDRYPPRSTSWCTCVFKELIARDLNSHTQGRKVLKMRKGLLTTMAIVCVSIFSLPLTASASPVLTESETALPIGASVKATNTGSIALRFNEGQLWGECSSAEIKGTVGTNSGTSVVVEVPLGSAVFAGTGLNGVCTSQSGPFEVVMLTKMCLSSTSEDQFWFTGCGNNVELRVGAASAYCKYRFVGKTTAFSTNTDLTWNLFNQPLTLVESHNRLCPLLSLFADFDVTTTNGATVLVS